MRLTGIIWLRDIVDKLEGKHSVTTDEVEEVLGHTHRFRLIERGDVEGEDLYAAMGQTSAGTLPQHLLLAPENGEALIVSARDLTKKEKRSYAKK